MKLDKRRRRIELEETEKEYRTIEKKRRSIEL